MSILFVVLAAPIVASTVVAAALARMARTPPRTVPAHRTQTPNHRDLTNHTYPSQASAPPRSSDADARHHAAAAAARSSETAA